MFRSSALCCVLLLSLAVSVLSPALFAQTGPTAAPQQAPRTAPQVLATLPSYEGQNVTSVELAGQPGLNITDYQNLLAQKPGTPLSRAKVEQTIDALQRTGRFHAVELEIRPEPNGIRVIFVLQPAMYFGVYEFPGAIDQFAYSRLLQVADYPPRGAFTTVDVENARNGLERFFQRSGFFKAKVTSDVQVDKDHGLVNVTFNTDLGRRAKFGDLKITGTTPEESAMLASKVRGIIARLKNSSIIPGKSYNLKRLRNATTYMEDTLMKQHRLAAQVQLVGANYDPETNRADITFNVKTGPIVNVRVEGAHLWSWTRNKLLPVNQQAGLGPELIQEGRQNLISHFQQQGYFDTKVTTNVQQDPSGETIVYTIVKGPRHKVSDIDIVGNQALSEKDLTGHVKVSKARFFSHGDYSEQLLRQSVNNLKKVYQANGYSDVKVTPQVKTEQNGNIEVTFHIQEGQQDKVEAMHVVGNNTMPTGKLAPGGLKLGPGQPYSQKLVDDDRNRILQTYLLNGYLNASFRASAKEIGKDKHHLDVTYNIEEGPRVQTAKVVMLGRKDTLPRLIDRTTQLTPGAPMREDQLLASENELYNLGVFDWAEVDPRRTITTQTEEDAVIKVHEAKKNTITYGFGFEVINRGGSLPSGTVALPGLPPVGLPSNFRTSQKTFWGPRGNFTYTRKNFRGKAETITIAGLAARLDQRLNIAFLDPHFRFTKWSANLTLSGERDSENPIFTSRLFEAGWQFQRALNKDKTTNFFLRYSFREVGLANLLLPDLVPPQDRHIRLSTVSATYVRDSRDNVLDATKGLYESFELGVNPSWIGSKVDFARLLAQTAYYRKIFSGIVWANSIRIGLEQAFNGSHVPISEEFFSGGGSTLRGFPLNGAGPQHDIQACGTPGVPSTCAFITVPLGGNQLFIFNSELRIPVPMDLPIVHKNLGLATFYDGGNVYQHVGFSQFIANYTNTVGIGLRYKTPVGPVRIDIGHNLNSPPGIKSTQFFVTLGQAF
jgi:outer membrane protein insertion porin family